jgi:acyl-CoA synthetase (AMP-forming)/AMP-acid ligase II
MNHGEDRIRFIDLARGVLGTLPELGRVNRGVLNLALMKPDKRQSVGQLLQRQAAKSPDAPALRFEKRTWSYEEFNRWANRHSNALGALGVQRGDAVAVLMENRAEVLAAVAGIVKLGAIAGMLNYNHRGEALVHSLRVTQPKVVIVGEECAEALRECGYLDEPEAPIVLWDGEGKAPAGLQPLRAQLEAASAGNPPGVDRIEARTKAFYIFTSGTTGLPKASVMTHYRWLRGMAGLGQMAVRLKPDDVFYCALPLYHNNALTVSWGTALGAGACLALGRRFSASRFWDEIRANGATSFCYIGELLRYLLNQPPSPKDQEHAVRVIVGNGLRPELWDDFKTRFGIERIAEFYGASEGNLAFVNGFGVDRTAGYCPLSFAIVEFDGESETAARTAGGFLKKVGKGGVGLLITEISDRAPFDGYTDSKSTESKLLRDVFKRGDAWFNTGDLVRDQGFKHIQFVDRVGDTFRWKGENVATSEVEGAIGRFDGVQHAVVYGVQVPGTDGRAGMAALSLAGGLAAFDGTALAAHLRGCLPAYAVPLFLRLQPEPETTGTFKYRKVELKREGFDPARVDEPLFLLDADAYRPLTREDHTAIAAGTIRF